MFCLLSSIYIIINIAKPNWVSRDSCFILHTSFFLCYKRKPRNYYTWFSWARRWIANAIPCLSSQWQWAKALTTDLYSLDCYPLFFLYSLDCYPLCVLHNCITAIYIYVPFCSGPGYVVSGLFTNILPTVVSIWSSTTLVSSSKLGQQFLEFLIDTQDRFAGISYMKKTMSELGLWTLIDEEVTCMCLCDKCCNTN